MSIKKKKIVYIAQSFGGGVTEYLYLLLSNMDRTKYENVLILSEEYKNQENRFKEISEKIYFVPMVRNINLIKDLKAIIKLKKIIKREKTDIVYLHSSKAGAIGRIALAFKRKVRILYNPHGWYFNATISKLKKKIYAIIEKILAIKTYKIINISKSEYESAIVNKIAKPSKMCIIENGIDFSKFYENEKYKNQIRKALNITEKNIIIGAVGRLTEQKDPITLIKAFNILKKKYENIKLMYIGSGELEKEVLEYAKRNNIENDIIIAGWVDKVEQYISVLDIATLPSKWEGFGLALIEYMACNKPIVASNIGGIADIIQDGTNGLLFNSTNENDLAEKIESLIKNKDLCNKIVENNKKYMQKFDIKYVIEQHYKIIEEKN